MSDPATKKMGHGEGCAYALLLLALTPIGLLMEAVLIATTWRWFVTPLFPALPSEGGAA